MNFGRPASVCHPVTPWIAALGVGVDTLRANPLRTGLSTLGVVMGAASLAAVLSIGDGAEGFARARIAHEGMQVVTIQARTSETVDGLRVPRLEYPIFTLADAGALATALSPRADVSLVVEGTGLVQLGTPAVRRAVRVIATGARGLTIHEMRIAVGRAFTDAESAHGEHVVIVSSGLASALVDGPSAQAVGLTLPLGGHAFQVVGVLTPSQGPVQSLVAMVPTGAADAALVATPTPRVPELRVRAHRFEDVAGVREQVIRWVAGRDPRWPGQTTIGATGEERVRQVAQGILVFKILMGAITAISLVVGGIGIMNVLLASVAERTREIGVRRAVGASRTALVVQFLAESVAIAGAGSVLGVVLGLGAAFGVTALARARTGAFVYAGVTWQTVAFSALAAVTVGLAFGVYPALRAARLSPIDALRHE